MTLGQQVARGEISLRKAEAILRQQRKTPREPEIRFNEHIRKLNWNNVDMMEFFRVTRQTVTKKLEGEGIVETDVLALKGALLCKRIEEGMQPLLAVALYKDSK